MFHFRLFQLEPYRLIQKKKYMRAPKSIKTWTQSATVSVELIPII